MQQWLSLQDVSVVELKPTLILIDTPCDDQVPERLRSRTPSPHCPPPIDDHEDHEEDLYGLALLQRIVSESQLRNISKLVVPVPIVTFPTSASASGDSLDNTSSRETSYGCPRAAARRKVQARSSSQERTANRRMLKICLDFGATDVMVSPMNAKCITNLEVHAYRAHRDAAREQKAMLEVQRGRKRSWVGINEEKPFSYLREAMVSNLMSRICRIDIGMEEPVTNVKVMVPAERRRMIDEAVAEWHFCAHNFSEDELIVVSSTMFEHALSMPGLENWRMPTGEYRRRSTGPNLGELLARELTRRRTTARLSDSM